MNVQSIFICSDRRYSKRTLLTIGGVERIFYGLALDFYAFYYKEGGEVNARSIFTYSD